MKLSIVIPVYNEKGTLPAILKKILDVDLGGIEKEVIVVDDHSVEDVVLHPEFADHARVKHVLIRHELNRGKGAAVRTGLKHVTGDFVVIQDADLEYDPADYKILIAPLVAGAADVVYGSRFHRGKGKPQGMSVKNYHANRFLTAFSNLLTRMSLTDMETCYKMMTRAAADQIASRLTSDRFGIEPEITALVKKMRVTEVPIGYHGRTAEEGKKIGWSDGIEAVWKIIRFNV